LESALIFAVFYAPFILIPAACIWLVRARWSVRNTRWIIFLFGLVCLTAAFNGHFVLDWYLRHAHLDFWREAHAVINFARPMLLATVVALISSCFGKGYGRASGCLASVLIAIEWWFRGTAAY
jgi:hypothetical protein